MQQIVFENNAPVYNTTVDYPLVDNATQRILITSQQEADLILAYLQLIQYEELNQSAPIYRFLYNHELGILSMTPSSEGQWVFPSVLNGLQTTIEQAKAIFSFLDFDCALLNID